MGDDAWSLTAVRLFAFTVLPVLLALLHTRLDAGAKDRRRTVEVYLIYLFVLGVGAGGISGFLGHVFAADVVAESIGWPTGSPFQQEIGFVGLALGVLGVIAARRDDGFREATVLAIAIVGVGATVVHVVDIVQVGNLAPGNSLQNLANLLKPAMLVALLVVARRSDPVPDPAFDRWRIGVVDTTGIVTAVVGTGFGIGSSLGAVVPTTIVASVVAAGIIARSARSPSRAAAAPIG